MVDGDENCATDDRRNAEEDKNWPFALPVRGEEGATEGCDELDRAEGDIKQDGLK
jgi:hypothetical protein